MKMRQIITCTLAAALVLNSTVPLANFAAAGVTATQPIAVKSISIEESIQMAKDYSMQIRQIQIAKDNAMKAHSASENGGSQAGALLHEYNAYQRLYERGVKTESDVAALKMYQSMFNGEPSLTFEQMYDQFVYPMDVAPYQVYVQFQGLKVDEPNVISSIEYQTKQLYYGILSYQHSLVLMKDANGITEKKIKELELKYKVGQVAKVTLDSEKLSYAKSQSELEKQKKELKVLEAQFNGLTGREKNTAVVLQDPGLLKATEVVNYEQMVSKALQNRGDLKKSQLEIDSLTHEVKIMSQYLRDPKLERRVDADQRLLTAKLAKAEMENEIKAELLGVYSNYKQAEEQLIVSKKKVELSEKQLTKIKQLFKVGYVKKLDVYGVELQLQNSKLGYESAVYEYNKQLDAVSRVTLHALN